VKDLYISRIGLSIFLKPKIALDTNVEIGTEVAQFPEKESINGMFFAVWLHGKPKWRRPLGLTMWPNIQVNRSYRILHTDASG
jgi:hypothetical protein